MKQHKQFDMEFFEDAAFNWPVQERTYEVHAWFDEPVQWPNSHRLLPNAGLVADWGEQFPNPPKAEERTGAEQIRHILNYMERAHWTPTTFPLITTYGELVELGLDWYQDSSPLGMKYWRPIEIINGVQYRGMKRPWFLTNDWPGKLHGEERDAAGLNDDPIIEGARL